VTIKSGVMALIAALALAACVPGPSPTESPRPEQRGDEPTTASSESTAFASYYRSVEARLVGQGRLRTDGGQADAPISAARLAANFERIALYDEYQLVDGRFVAQQTPSRLRRWESPVRIQAHFGPSVSADQRGADQSVLSTYASRLSRTTGHPIRTVRSGGNFHVLYLNRDEQRSAGSFIRQLVPGIGPATVREIENMPRSTFCSVYAFSESGGRPVYVTAVAIIREEHPDLLRRSCVHEEIAQGLGLPNDSPSARPSIFNDDEEFALLTPHDELLLRMLYDRRLQIGMEPDQARPIVRALAQQYLGGPS